MNSPATSYDAAGNLTSWNGAVYQYDRFNQMIRMTSGSEDWAYIYTADDERFWSYQIKDSGSFSRWTLRDLGGKVPREYLSDNGRWSVGTDYIYRDGSLLAAETQTGRRHFHLDHLGTPRLITRGSGYRAAYHVYYPFGEELTAFNQDTERMKFTGHERDLNSAAGAGDDLDYMHARFYSPVTARFTGVDPVLGKPKYPESWNRYLYGLDNPVKYVDKDGRAIETAWDIFNLGLGVASLAGNIAQGNISGALVDAGGLVVDVAATAVPFVPGGAGAAIKAARVGKAAVNITENAKAGRSFERSVLAALGIGRTVLRKLYGL